MVILKMWFVLVGGTRGKAMGSLKSKGYSVNVITVYP